MQDKQLVSSFVLSNLSSGITNGSFLSTVILVDMSGFTSLTDKAMQKGTGGAEWISQILSVSFTPLIDFVEQTGGFIAEFEGDATLAIFPGNKPELLRKVQNIFKAVSSEIDENISFSISAVFGKLYWGIGGVNGINYQLFYGKPISEIFNIKAELPKQFDWKCKSVEEYQFYPPSVFRKTFFGEFRTVYSAFLSLKVLSTFEAQQFFETICEQTLSFDGFLSGTYLRGANALVFVVFGVPKAHESDARRCGEFALKVSKLFPELSCGITSGTAYAGFVGSKNRCDYTVHGTSVNLASRLCDKANPGEILVNPNFSELIFPYFAITKGYVHELKGYTELQISFKLIEPKILVEKSKENSTFIGRQEELAKLIELQKYSFETSILVTINILGEPGIGKSRFLNEFLNTLTDDIIVLQLTGDELKSSIDLYPWQSTLNDFPEFLFDEAAGRIAEQDLKTEFQEAVKYVKKLQDLSGSLTYNIEKMAYCISVLLHFVSDVKNVVIAIDDIHYLDSESIQLLKIFSAENLKSRCMLITTSRLKDQIPEYFIAEEFIQISALTAIETSDKLFADTEISVQDVMAKKLFLRSAGNPLYLEELSLLVQQDQLAGTWTTWQNLDKILPSTLASLLESRIDKLEAGLREAVFIASVLGFEFDSQILRHLLPVNSPVITRGLIFGIWKIGSRGKLAFKQQLLRETAYNMQLTSIRKKVHRKASDVILKIYPEPTGDLLVCLAMHLAKSDYSEMAIKYLEKAGDYCRTNHKNQSAIELYSELERFATDSNMWMRARGKKCAVLEVSGRWTEALKILQLSINKADLTPELFQHSGRMRISAGKLLMQQGKFDEAISILIEAENILSEADEVVKSAVYANLGAAWLAKNSFKKAEKYLNYWYDIAIKRSDKYSQVMAVGTLGVLADEMGDSEKAHIYYNKQLELGLEINQPLFVAHSYLAFGNAEYDKGNFASAQSYYQKSLTIYKQLGNRSGESVVCGAIGKLFLYKQNFNEVLKFSTFYLNVSIALDKKSRLFDARSQLFEAYLYSGDLPNALGILNTIQSNTVIYKRNEVLFGKDYLSGLLEMKKGNFSKALKYFELSVESIQKSNMIPDRIHLILIGFMYAKTGELVLARTTFKDAVGISVSEDISIENQLVSILNEVKDSVNPNLFDEIELLLMRK